VLLVTGARSFRESPAYGELLGDGARAGWTFEEFVVSGEPSPELVDEAVSIFRDADISVVVGIGGGSVMDAAKAIAGLLPFGNSVMDHLEGVGRGIPYQGPPLPMVAVPTTAGTGSEATKNAVLSRRGAEGFKKSFRHERLVPAVALIDPMLMWDCPREQTAAAGLDALTQLLESYVTKRSNIMTRALAGDALQRVAHALPIACEGGYDEEVQQARSDMAYGALISGITLANAGLGAVHGLASPLGAYFPIPHGAVCGTLVAEVAASNIEAMQSRSPENPALGHYLILAQQLTGISETPQAALNQLIEWLRRLVEGLGMPRLGSFGMVAADIERVVANCRGGSMRGNPVELEDDEIAALLERRL
jgi:alcohol dehydrogenase